MGAARKGTRSDFGGTTEAFGPGPEWRGKKSIIIGRAMGKRRNGGTVGVVVTHSNIKVDFWSGQVHNNYFSKATLNHVDFETEQFWMIS
jgi:hypothetical protein